MAANFLNSGPWKKLREQTRNRWKSQCRPCGICGNSLDWSKGRTSVDHIVPRRVRPDLALEPSNLQVVCKRCHDSVKQRIENGTDVRRIGSDGFPEGSEWA